jgi:hypothetical protein
VTLFPVVQRECRDTIEEKEREQAKFIAALRSSGDEISIDLADRLSRCRQSRERLRAWAGPPHLHDVLSKNGRYRCERHGCWSCRRGRIREVAVREAPRFANADPRFCSLITIADSLTFDLETVKERVTQMTRALRDRRDAMVARRPRWRQVEFVGHVELDAVLAQDVERLPPDQHHLLPQLPVVTRAGGDVVWVIRAHLAVRHEGVDQEEVVGVLRQQWPGDRVHAKQFDDGLALENAGRILSYSQKAQQVTTLDLLAKPWRERWPVGWQVTFWTWVHRLRRGFEPFRISVGPRRPPRALPALPAPRRLDPEQQQQQQHDEPMPILFGFSEFRPRG